MAFQYPLYLPTELGQLNLTRWCINEWEPVRVGIPIAEFQSGSKCIVALANGTGVLWKKLVAEGEGIHGEVAFALLAAEGEDIPYGKPYVTFEERG